MFITHLKSFICVIHVWILSKLFKVVMMTMVHQGFYKGHRIGHVMFTEGEFFNYYSSSGIDFFSCDVLKLYEIKVQQPRKM